MSTSGPDRLPRRLGVRAIRVMIVEDERLLAEMLSNALADEDDIRVIGVAGSVAEAVALVHLQPDVVLMDYRLPDGTGAMATRIIKQRWAPARVVMLSALRDDETLMDSIQAGADGYLTKDGAVEDLLAAVRAARDGETLLPHAVILEIAQRVGAARDRQVDLPRIDQLTLRQLEILRCLAAGQSNVTIAAELGVSPNTVRTHVDHLLRRLGAHSKLEAVAIALRHGLIEVPRDDRRGM